MVRCSKCGKEGVTAWQPHRCEAAPEAPRSSARSPSRRKQGKAPPPQEPSPPGTTPPTRTDPYPDTPDTAPFPDPPRSNARSPNRRKPDKAHTQDRPAQQTSSCEEALRDTRSPASPGTPDTAPSVITPSDLSVITDAELTACYNKVMREVMSRRRAKARLLRP